MHQDGLVHISELSNRYIKDPGEAVKVGQIVKVKVLSADAKTKRIALSMKALLESRSEGTGAQTANTKATGKTAALGRAETLHAFFQVEGALRSWTNRIKDKVKTPPEPKEG